MEEELYMVMDDTNNFDFSEIPEIDPDIEAELKRKVTALLDSMFGEVKSK